MCNLLYLKSPKWVVMHVWLRVFLGNDNCWKDFLMSSFREYFRAVHQVIERRLSFC
jgi:hypothetical protein